MLTYDAENRLTRVEKSGGVIAEFTYGPGGERAVIWHMTQGDHIESALRAFEERETSAHYLIDRDGTIYQLIPDEYAAWHAGGRPEKLSHWETSKYGEEVTLEGIEVNRHSIGVEVVGYTPKHERKGYEGVVGYTEAQKRSATELARWLAYAYGLGPSAMIGHLDVCPPPEKYDGHEHLFMIRAAVSPRVSAPAPGYGGLFP